MGLNGLGRLARLGALLASLPTLASCADCFFKVQGKLVDCSTLAPLAGATVTVRIDQGLHGVRTIPMTFPTDAAGNFSVHTDGTETCSAWATLIFTRDGYATVESQYQGAPKKQVDVCMSALAAK